MTKRELLLAAGVGLLLVAVAGVYLYSGISKALALRHKEIARFQKQVDDLEKKVAAGKRAEQRLKDLEARSLPSDRELSRSLYQSWLLDVAEEVGLADRQVRATEGRVFGDDFYRMAFVVSGRGDLAQLVQLLHRFYSIIDLHQIRRLGIRPIAESRDLEITLSIEAVVMPNALRTDSVADVSVQRLLYDQLDDYNSAILGRNLFAPPNKPPQLSSIGSKEVALGSSVSFTASAKDPDSLDRVRFRLGDDAPPGAAIGESAGDFRWKPERLGEYAATVVAYDDGFPSKSDSEVVRIRVVEPPPPAPPRTAVVERPKLSFDDAKHAFVTAIVSDRAGRRQLWLTIRTSGKIMKLHEGDKFSVGSVEGVIRRIGEKDAEFEADKKRVQVSVGDNLLEGEEQPVGGL